ncbi:MAG: nitroreductase/quinone reductase family protein [Mycobacteriales bacterium]
MPSDLLLKTTNSVHRFALKLTGGRVGWQLKGMPVVQLTTTGRKSGEPRTVMLTSPYQEDDTVVVVGSRGGDDKPPAWLLNVQASGDVRVAMNGGDPVPYGARVADPAERARLWPLVTKDYPHYAGYQTKTD